MMGPQIDDTLGWVMRQRMLSSTADSGVCGTATRVWLDIRQGIPFPLVWYSARHARLKLNQPCTKQKKAELKACITDWNSNVY